MQSKGGGNGPGLKGAAAISSAKGSSSKANNNNEMLPEIGGKFSSWAKED